MYSAETLNIYSVLIQIFRVQRAINGVRKYQAWFCRSNSFHDYTFFFLSLWLLPLHPILCRDSVGSITEADARGPGSLVRIFCTVCKTKGFHEPWEQVTAWQRATGKQAVLHIMTENHPADILLEDNSSSSLLDLYWEACWA